MKIILLSGGSGTRLWPLSNDSRAKQFIKVLHNQETHEMESMLERVYCQLLKIVSADDIIIATNKLQVDMIANQLGNIPMIIEPERRDTFPAIALACSYLYSHVQIAKDEIVAVVSVDTYVDTEFYKMLKELEQLVQTTDAQIGLIGIKPTYPSSKYGYLIPREVQSYMTVDRFKEKPTEEEAEQLIVDGSYWNSGIFVFQLQLIIDHLENLKMPVNYKDLLDRFTMLPKKSFDYELLETLDSIVALTYDGYWKDLGTWNTLTEEMSQNVIGNGGLSDDCHNTHIVNELELPVKVLGISNAVIAVSPDGILVTDKPSSSRMKDMLHEGLFSRPMYEERRWGWYRILDYSKSENNEVLTKRLCIKAGFHFSYHYHNMRTEIWTVTAGRATLVLDGIAQVVTAGAVIEIPSGTRHCLKAQEDTELIEVQIGMVTVDDDIVRLEEDIQYILTS
ncbi:sugar phosphate nucleotidyltransferase [Paenibacillus macerans]|uniref:sugar phosphate nucleotidyltransferase n=1 Tax=Paenibacillus macerans TaxID=44252 RepID=UPI0020415B4D|nr:sugar phosphate nucleotidyltransferase [Paenibacillus macerans]MCM3701058.1 sugar phosphate nucleotidyltransferase [Paenibacillus macerans]